MKQWKGPRPLGAFAVALLILALIAALLGSAGGGASLDLLALPSLLLLFGLLPLGSVGLPARAAARLPAPTQALARAPPAH